MVGFYIFGLEERAGGERGYEGVKSRDGKMKYVRRWTVGSWNLLFIDANWSTVWMMYLLLKRLDIDTSTNHRIVQQPDRYVVVFFDFS